MYIVYPLYEIQPYTLTNDLMGIVSLVLIRELSR